LLESSTVQAELISVEKLCCTQTHAGKRVAARGTIYSPNIGGCFGKERGDNLLDVYRHNVAKGWFVIVTSMYDSSESESIDIITPEAHGRAGLSSVNSSVASQVRNQVGIDFWLPSHGVQDGASDILLYTEPDLDYLRLALRHCSKLRLVTGISGLCIENVITCARWDAAIDGRFSPRSNETQKAETFRVNIR
jgi:hypothetical protein